jgi:hypothetical protein
MLVNLRNLVRPICLMTGNGRLIVLSANWTGGSTNRGLPSTLVASFLQDSWWDRDSRSRAPQQGLASPAERVRLNRNEQFRPLRSG